MEQAADNPDLFPMTVSSSLLFPVTPKSLVASARCTPGNGADDSEARWKSRLAELCGMYHGAIVGWFAAVGAPGDPRDMAHDFLHRWLGGNPLAAFDASQREFRPFLKASLRNFLVESIRRARAERRGGRAEHVAVEEDELPWDAPGAHELADRLLAREVALRALATLERAATDTAAPGRRELLRRILDRQAMPDADLAAILGISVNALRQRVTRLRQQFWAAYFQHAQQLCRGAAAEDEFATLVQVMQRDPTLIDALAATLDGRAQE